MLGNAYNIHPPHSWNNVETSKGGRRTKRNRTSRRLKRSTKNTHKSRRYLRR